MCLLELKGKLSQGFDLVQKLANNSRGTVLLIVCFNTTSKLRRAYIFK